MQKLEEEDQVSEVLTVDQNMALKELNLNIKHGEFVCIIGDVGSGKSSLLNSIIGDLLYLDEGYLATNREENVNQPGVARNIMQYSQKKYSPNEAPIVISESVAYV